MSRGQDWVELIGARLTQTWTAKAVMLQVLDNTDYERPHYVPLSALQLNPGVDKVVVRRWWADDKKLKYRETAPAPRPDVPRRYHP